MRAAFRPLFWFLLPWLIILLVPQLRLISRVQAVGSEYDNGDAVTPLTIWIHPLPPTARELSKQFAPGAAPPEIGLKAPQKRGDWVITPKTATHELDAALQKPDAPLWMLAARLHLALADIHSQRVFPAASRFDWGDFPSECDSLPIAGHGGWNGYEDQSLPTFPPSIATPPLAVKPLALPQEKFAAPLRLARRGSVAEPDNAFWRVQIAYLLTLAQHDDEATRELLAAAKCSRYDSHLRDEMRAALRVARLQRPLLWHEKLAVAARQDIGSGFPRCEQALLWLAERAEKSGDLSVTAALARVASLMQRGAASSNDTRRALLLQSATWGGNNRPAQVTVAGGGKTSVWPRSLMAFEYDYTGYNATPLDFALPFASFARAKGHTNLADEALAQGREATRFAARLSPYWGKDRFGIAPTHLVPAAACDANAEMALVQVQLVAFVWLILGFVLWRRIAWAGRLIARSWQILALIWRVRDKPLDDEVPVELTHSSRDLRRSVWLGAALVLLGAGGATWWSDALSNWYSALTPTNINVEWQQTAFLAFVCGPLIGGFLWCGSAALWRYARLQAPLVPRDDVETYALHIPPSIIPRAVLLMCCCVTAGAALSWILWLLTQRLGVAALNFSFPPSWIQWLRGNPNAGVDLAVRDLSFPIVCAFVTLGVWLAKWVWQMHPRRRFPALGFGLRWLRATLGVWLILGSWLYLALLLIALPYHRAASEQIEKVLPTTELSLRNGPRS